jgi:hypothetical protein
MSESWYKEYCPYCDTRNWICNGDEQDLSGMDVEGIKCRNCDKIFMLGDFDVEEFLKDFQYEKLEDINWEVGLENPD